MGLYTYCGNADAVVDDADAVVDVAVAVADECCDCDCCCVVCM